MGSTIDLVLGAILTILRLYYGIMYHSDVGKSGLSLSVM